MLSPDYEKAKLKAEELITKYGIEHPFVNVFAIAENEGLSLKEFSPTDDVLKHTSGFFDPKTKTIYINKEDPPNRITFTVAHELGHYILQHEENAYGVLPRWQIPGIEKEAIEKEADAFAANLLVPKSMLKNVMDHYGLTRKDASTLARMFGVSEEAMRYRLINV